MAWRLCIVPVVSLNSLFDSAVDLRPFSFVTTSLTSTGPLLHSCIGDEFNYSIVERKLPLKQSSDGFMTS